MELKDILRNRRIELGLTLEEIAQLVEVVPATISRWESGAIANMRRDRIVKYAKALKISPAVIMEWNNNQVVEPAPAHDFSAEELALIQQYRQLNADDKEEINAIISLKLAKTQRSAKEGAVS